MDRSKIQLSEEEMQLVTNSAWILTKQGIIQKLVLMFGQLSEAELDTWKITEFSGPRTSMPPKISKGEQYENLPYMVLDYPRIFTREDILAIRQFFWWGNYFSITLHLKGYYLQLYGTKINNAIEAGLLDGFSISVTGSEFEFNLNGSCYTLLTKENRFQYKNLALYPFVKISHAIPLGQWHAANNILLEYFQKLKAVLTD
jgi:hypothetical protein